MLHVANMDNGKNKGADQTAQMHGLIWACVVHMQQSQVFSCRGSYVADISQNRCASFDNLSE